MHRRVAAIVAVLAALFLASCTDDGNSSQAAEREVKQQNYDAMVKSQPAESMGYSPTRETINFWVNTWDEPNKLSYVYLMAANGELIGYYVLEGLPVSYCASQTPTYLWEDRPGDGSSSRQQVPAPAMDGVYYFGGGSCDTYYGKDATTGTYIEYTAGMGINVLLYEEPLPRQDVQPLGKTRIEDVDN